MSEASVMMLVGASETGWFNRVALARASFAFWNASVTSDDRLKIVFDFLDNRDVSGCTRRAQFGMKWW